MQDLDFEQVRGFEPNVISPYRPFGTVNEPRHGDSILKMAAQLEHLDELTLMLQKTTELQKTAEVDDSNEQPSVPFKSRSRQYSRLPVSDKWRPAEFRILGCKYRCQIVEISIGGFGILLPKLMAIQPGTLGHLRSAELNYIVSVTRIEPRAEGSFIGLKQVEEIIENDPYHPNGGASTIGYLAAGIAGTLIAVISYYLMQSS